MAGNGKGICEGLPLVLRPLCEAADFCKYHVVRCSRMPNIVAAACLNCNGFSSAQFCQCGGIDEVEKKPRPKPFALQTLKLLVKAAEISCEKTQSFGRFALPENDELHLKAAIGFQTI